MTQSTPKSAGGKTPPPRRPPVQFALIHEHAEWVLVAKEKFAEKYNSEMLFPHSHCSLLQVRGWGIHHVIGIKLRKPQELLTFAHPKKDVHLLELVAMALMHDAPAKNERHFLLALEGYAKVGVWLLHHPDIIVPDHCLRPLKH